MTNYQRNIKSLAMVMVTVAVLLPVRALAQDESKLLQDEKLNTFTIDAELMTRSELRIKVYNMLGECPYSMRNKRVEFSPINEVAHAIVMLATTPRQCCVFHPYNIHTQFLGDVLMGLHTVGEGIKFVEQEDFEKAMEEAKSDPAKANQMASLLAYQDMAHGQKTTDVTRDNDYTTQVLYRLGFAWSPTSWDYVERMLTAIGGLGFFDM